MDLTSYVENIPPQLEMLSSIAYFSNGTAFNVFEQ